MKLAKVPRFYFYSWLFSMPLITYSLMYIMYENRVWHEWKIWVVSYAVIYAIGYVSWMLHAQYDLMLRKKFPSLQQTTKRVIYKLAVNLFIMSPSILLILYVFQQFNILGYEIKEGDLKYGFLAGLVVNVVFETLFEVVFIIERYKESIAEKDQFEQLQLQQEFDVLKQKVNPHFLFNCFNTLSALIPEDKEKAEQFLDELSKVYRYLLKNNEDGLSTVENEIQFIESYARLLTTRHGSAVQINIEVERQYNNYLLPSLSLQMLVENVVKHNGLSKNKPLYIEIFTAAGNKLVVNNNLQRRTIKAPAGKVGLKNIEAKYQLLQTQGFQVIEDDKNFTVVLPLLWNNNAEKKKITIAQRPDEPFVN